MNAWQELSHLRVAVGFLTRLPMGDVSQRGSIEVSMSRAAAWFPVVGSLIGGIAALTFWASAQQLGPLASGVLSLVVVLLVTGAFHLDGLADMADAFGGGWTIERRLEILKDSRLGTYGTAAVASALLLEVVLLAEIADQVDVAAVLRFLVGGHVVSRTLAVFAMRFGRVAGDGLGASYAADLTTLRTLVGGTLGAAISLVTFAEYGAGLTFGLWLAGGLGAAAVSVLAYRKIGGITGDVLGAIQQVSYLASLACFAILQ